MAINYSKANVNKISDTYTVKSGDTLSKIVFEFWMVLVKLMDGLLFRRLQIQMV